jgi:hypothetical protein
MSLMAKAGLLDPPTYFCSPWTLFGIAVHKICLENYFFKLKGPKKLSLDKKSN